MEDHKVAVLLEDIAHKFNILAEGQELIRQDIQSIKTVTGQMYEDIEGVIKPTLKQQSQDLKQHGQDLMEIKNQLNILTDELISINPDSKPRLKKIN